jgi:hypothetical protein
MILFLNGLSILGPVLWLKVIKQVLYSNPGYIWGRGAIDSKVGVFSILEAAELLLSDRFVPKR